MDAKLLAACFKMSPTNSYKFAITCVLLRVTPPRASKETKFLDDGIQHLILVYKLSISFNDGIDYGLETTIPGQRYRGTAITRKIQGYFDHLKGKKPFIEFNPMKGKFCSQAAFYYISPNERGNSSYRIDFCRMIPSKKIRTRRNWSW